MKLKKVSIPFVLLLGVLLLPSVSMVRTAGAGVGADAARGSLRYPQQLAQNSEACQIAVLVDGNGDVRTATASGEVALLTQDGDVPLPCGEQIQLSAVPGGGWRFDRWEGVSEVDRQRVTIQVTAPAAVKAVFMPRTGYPVPVATPFYDRSGELVSEIERLEPIAPQVPDSQADAASAFAAAPVIDIWYTDSQSFGQIGTPQEWINVLGNVFDADGIASLSYKLNGGSSKPLSYGGDDGPTDARRLWNPGDFNIDIDKDDLKAGSNDVAITAEDSTGQKTTVNVTVNYEPATDWPIPYDINWNNVSAIQDVAQIVDGKWRHSAAGVTPVETGYDRIVAIGEGSFNGTGWREFEVRVEVTVHGYSEEGFKNAQVAPAVGLVARWQGHTDTPVAGCQPKCGWLPVGAVGWYTWDEDTRQPYYTMWAHHARDEMKPAPAVAKMILNQTYYWKMRVENVSDSMGTYYFKVWKKGSAEPGWQASFDSSDRGWNYTMLESGSILLLAHHVDVTFGEVQVRPLNSGSDNTAPVIDGVKVVPEPAGATVKWTTDEPSSGLVKYGTTSGYGSSQPTTQMATSHSVFLPNLTADSPYHFQITASDLAGNTSKSSDATFSTQKLVSLVSDDFNACQLNSVWQFVDPLNDAGYETNTTQVIVQVPAGTNHDIYPRGNLPVRRAPRIMQDVTDPNRLKVKFESGVAAETAMQGILLEQDAENFLRINYQYINGETKLFVIGFASGKNPQTLKNIVIRGAPMPGPLYLLVERGDGKWRVSYSTDDVTWPDSGLFQWPLSVTKAGVFAGNYSSVSGQEPEVDAVIDYVVDLDNPINPEDGRALILPVSVQGGGKVLKSSECGNPVTLTAVPDSGWLFDRWVGAPLDGNRNANVTTGFSAGNAVTAVFVKQGDTEIYQLNVVVAGQGSVVVSPEKQTYSRGEKVELKAIPEPRWYFESWAGDIAANADTTFITIEGHMMITANFAEYSSGYYLPMVVGKG